ncbi:MAG TPA: DHA2 family efflux MFS transporter permease subunit [Candidatus Dormibacteraeota bacterium]|nr:DHA2 family efflux MFS transporter permease subunit [Candidatus Dormibacteraeota bacterium]
MTVARSFGRRSSPVWVVALASAAFFMSALDLLVVMTALPAMQRQFGAGLATLQWTVNAYSLASAAGIITAAALADRLGRRLVFVSGLVLFTSASAACALAPAAEFLIGARAVQGVGAALLAPTSLTILASAFPPERRGAIVGIWGGLGGLAIAAGPLVGGAVTQGLSWHWIFWVNVPIGVVAAALSCLRLAESRGPATQLDIPAVALVSAGATGVVFGLVRAAALGWGAPQVVGSLVLGVLLLAGFAVWERRTPEPMLPPRLFRRREFVAANISTFLTSASLLGAAFLVSQYLQVVQGSSPLLAGLRFLPMTATPLVVSPAAGMLSDRVGRRPVMMVGLVLLAVGLGWLALVATAGADYGPLVLPLLVAGAGVSMSFATAPSAALSAVSPADMGKASGANGTFQRFGAAFGIAVATAIFTANGQMTTAAGFTAGMRPALGAAAALALVGAAAALGVSGRRRSPAPSTPPVAVPAGAVSR